MIWYLVWTFGWPMFIGYWAFLLAYMSEEISERMVRVSFWMMRLGYVGMAITAFFLPYVDLPWIVRS